MVKGIVIEEIIQIIISATKWFTRRKKLTVKDHKPAGMNQKFHLIGN